MIYLTSEQSLSRNIHISLVQGVRESGCVKIHLFWSLELLYGVKIEKIDLMDLFVRNVLIAEYLVEN